MNFRSLLRSETSLLGRVLHEPGFWLVLLVMLVAGSLAYRVPYAYALDIGGSPGGLIYDHPYLVHGFNPGEEYDSHEHPTKAFRWAFGDAEISFPGVGRATRVGTLRVATGQPRGEPVPSGWSIDTTPLTTVPLVPGTRVYRLLLPAESSSLDIIFRTPTFVPPNDPRRLAFAADGFVFAPVASARPAPQPLALLAGATAAIYVLLRRWGGRQLGATAGGFAASLIFAGLLGWERLGLTTFALRLAGLLVGAYAGTVVLQPLLITAANRLGIAARREEIRAVTAVAILAWIIRLGGLLHPQAYTSDLGLHMHNLENLATGEVIFTEGLPARAGGGQAPYPPAQYVMLLPGRLLAGSRAVVNIGNTLADSLVVVWLWLMIRAAGGSRRAALFAGGLYLFAMPLLASLSRGEMANVWGQALVAPLFVLLLRWQHGLLPAWVLIAALEVALLGHFGVFLSLLLFFAVYGLLLVLVGGPWAKLGTIVGAALLLAGLGYYSAFAALLRERTGVGYVPLGLGRLRDELWSSLAPRGAIGPLAAGLGLAGLVLIWPRAYGLGLLLLAWWAGTLLSLAPLLWTQQALRWQAFFFPALALGGGIALTALDRWGRAGRALAYTLLGVVVVRGAALWYLQLATYQH